MTKTYTVRLDTPGIQYWVKTYDRISEELELTNGYDIPYLEETINESFEGKYIVEEADNAE